jgi:hypothetical protein
LQSFGQPNFESTAVVFAINTEGNVAVILLYRVFKVQADWTFILPSEFPAKSCATCREKCRRAATRTKKSDKPTQ